MNSATKYLFASFLILMIGLFGYYFLVHRPQEIRLRCLEIAKDVRKDIGIYGSTSRKYGTGTNGAGYYINQRMYDDCLEEAGLEVVAR